MDTYFIAGFSDELTKIAVSMPAGIMKMPAGIKQIIEMGAKKPDPKFFAGVHKAPKLPASEQLKQLKKRPVEPAPWEEGGRIAESAGGKPAHPEWFV